MNNYFIAVIPDEKVKQKISFELEKIKNFFKRQKEEEYKDFFKGLKFVDKSLFHITLKFIGKNEEEAFKIFDSFNIKFQKFSAFKYDFFTFKNSDVIRVFFIKYLSCNSNYHLTLFRSKNEDSVLNKDFFKKYFEEKNNDFVFFDNISFFANKIFLLKSEFKNGILKYKILKEKETLQNFIK